MAAAFWFRGSSSANDEDEEELLILAFDLMAPDVSEDTSHICFIYLTSVQGSPEINADVDFYDRERNLKAAIGQRLREEESGLDEANQFCVKMLLDFIVMHLFSWTCMYPQQRRLHCAHQWVESQFQLLFNSLRVNHDVLRLSKQHVSNFTRRWR